jgi:MFS family permease
MAVGILLLFFIFSYIDRNILAIVVDPVRTSIGLSNQQMGLLIGVALASAYAAAGIPFGWLVDRYDRRFILFCGVVCWGIATAACGYSQTFEQFFILRMLIGVGEASLMPAAQSLIGDLFSRDRLGIAFSTFSMGPFIGAGVSLIVGGWLVHELVQQGAIPLPGLSTAEPWRAVFVIVGLVGAALSCLIFLFPEPVRNRGLQPAASSAASAEGLFSFLRRRWKIWAVFAIVFGGMTICNGALIFWQPTYMSRYFHWNPAEYGLALGLTSGPAGILGLIVSGTIVDRMGKRGIKDAPLRYYLTILVVTTPLVLIALLSSNVWIYLGLIWVAQFGTINMVGLGLLSVQLTTPQHLRGRVAALLTTVVMTLIGASIGASLPAYIARNVLHDEVRLGHSIAVIFAVFAPLAIAALLLGRRAFRAAVVETENELSDGKHGEEFVGPHGKPMLA